MKQRLRSKRIKFTEGRNAANEYKCSVIFIRFPLHRVHLPSPAVNMQRWRLAIPWSANKTLAIKWKEQVLIWLPTALDICGEEKVDWIRSLKASLEAMAGISKHLTNRLPTSVSTYNGHSISVTTDPSYVRDDVDSFLPVLVHYTLVCGLQKGIRTSAQIGKVPLPFLCGHPRGKSR